MRRALVAAAIAALALASTGSAQTIGLGQPANGKTVHVHVGGSVEITLTANASTGYSWQLAALNLNILRPISIGLKTPAPTNPPTVGGPDTYVVDLFARAKGTTTVRLEYVAPGTGGAVSQRYRVTVVVS
jgi:inhibitor of cysteine peptidase